MDVRLPDGRILRNVPEGTTKAQIAEKLGIDMATGDAAPAAAARPQGKSQVRTGRTSVTPTDYAEREIVSGPEFIANQARQGVANLGGMMQWITDKSMMSPMSAIYQRQEGVPSRTEQWSERMGARPDLTTENIPARMTGRALEYGISGAPLAPVGPAAYAVGTLGAAVGDVVGDEIAGERGRFPGAMVGSIITPSGIVKAIERTARGAYKGSKTAVETAKLMRTPAGRRLLQRRGRNATQGQRETSSQMIDTMAKSDAAHRLAAVLDSDPNSEAAILEFNKYLDELERITGERPTVSLADVLQDSELLEMQRMRASRSPQLLHEAKKQYGETEQLLDTAEQKIAGGPDDERFLSELGQRVDDQTAALEGRMEGLRTQQAEALGPLRQQRDPAAAGAQIRNLVTKERMGVKQRFDEAFDTLRKEVGDAPFDIDPLLKHIESVADDLSGQLAPENYPGILRNIKKLSEKWADDVPEGLPQTHTATLDDVWKQLQELTSDISDLEIRVKAKPTVIRELSRAVDVVLDDVLAKGGKSPISPEATQRLLDLRQKYRMEYIDRFRVGQTGQLARKKTTGDLAVTNEKVVEGYLSSDTNMGRLMSAVGDDPEAMALFDDSVIGLYAAKVDPNASGFRPGSHNSFMQKHGAALRKHRPDLYERLNTTGPTLEDLGKSINSTLDEMTSVRKQAITKHLQLEDTNAIVDQALKGRNSMADLLRRWGTKDRDVLEATVLTRLLSKAKTPEKTLELLEDKQNLNALKILLAGRAEKTVREMKAVAAIRHILSDPNKYPLNPEAIKEAGSPVMRFMREHGLPYVQVMSALRAIGRRPGSGDYFIGIGAVQATQAVKSGRMGQQMYDLQAEIMANPDMRRAILQSYQKKVKLPEGPGSSLFRQIGHAGVRFAKHAAKSTATRAAIPLMTPSSRVEEETPVTP